MAARLSPYSSGIAGLLLLFPQAKAVVLGDIRSGSRVGQVLTAEIEVAEHPAERFDSSCLKLYRPESVTDDLPWITAARLSYRLESGKGRLIVVSQSPVQEPAVHLGIRSECAGAAVSRRYTLLLSPPAEEGDGQSAQPATMVSLPSRSVPQASRQAPNRGTAAQAPGRETSASAKGDGGGEAPLRLSDELAASGQTSALGRDLLRLEQRTLEMLNDPNNDRHALNEKLAWLEANVAELKRAGDRLEGAAAAIPAAALKGSGGDAAPDPGALPPAPAASPSPVLSPAAPGEASGQAAARPAGPAASPRSPASAAADSDQWLWYGGTGAAALLVLLGAFIRRGAFAGFRRPPLRRPSEPARIEGALAPRTETLAAPAERPAPTRVAATPAVPASHRAPLVEQAPVLPIEPENPGAAPALELAEIMLSFGRVGGAAKTLEEYLAAQPQESLRPWIRLLQIYQRNGMRDEFEALTLKLNRSFNVEIMRWDGGESREELELLPLDATREKAVTLEEIPRIRDQIIVLWGKHPDCRDYLEKLLRDNRDGQRSGFTLPVVEEVLFLIDLLEAPPGPKPFQHP